MKTVQELLFELQQAQLTEDFLEGERLARLIYNSFGTKDPARISVALLLAKMLKQNSKLDEAESTLNESILSHNDLKGVFDLELALLQVEMAQLLEEKGLCSEASSLLTIIIDNCETAGLLEQIHIPVICQVVLLQKLGRIDDGFSLLEKFLPIMKQTSDTSYRDELRNLWRSAANAKTDDISRLILDSEVQDRLTNKLQKGIEEPTLSNFGEDYVSDYLLQAQVNTYATFQNNKAEFEQLREIDARFQISREKAREIVIGHTFSRMGQDATLKDISREDWLQMFFLVRAQSALLAAMRLATSGQYAECYMVLRGALEQAMYCFRISDDPSMTTVWFERNNDDASKENQKNKFSIMKIAKQMSAVNADLSQDCAKLYDRLIDSGAHPNQDTFDALTSKEISDESVSLYVSVLDGKHIPELIDAVVSVGNLALEIFSFSMPGVIAARPKPKAES